MTEYVVNISKKKYRDAVSWLELNNYEYYSIPGPPWALWEWGDRLKDSLDEVAFVFNDKNNHLLFALKWA